MEIPSTQQFTIRFRNVTVNLMLQSQGFYHKDCYSNIVNKRNLERVFQR